MLVNAWNGWNLCSCTLKCLKQHFSLVWTFPPVTISWIKAVKAYDVSFYSTKIFLDQSKIFLDQSKTFRTWVKVQNSVVKSCFSSPIQNHLGPVAHWDFLCSDRSNLELMRWWILVIVNFVGINGDKNTIWLTKIIKLIWEIILMKMKISARWRHCSKNNQNKS